MEPLGRIASIYLHFNRCDIGCSRQFLQYQVLHEQSVEEPWETCPGSSTPSHDGGLYRLPSWYVQIWMDKQPEHFLVPVSVLRNS